jgi:hypothetical protein
LKPHLDIHSQEIAMNACQPFFSMRLVTLAAVALLSACGGGGSDDAASTDTTPSAETAQSVSANGMVVSEDAADATSETLKTTQAVVAGAQASQTYACAGGGTAVYTVTGSSGAALTNGALDTGETYSLTFTACRGSAGAASLDGTMTLAVTAASTAAVTVQTSTQGIVVALPNRTLTLNGSSTLAQAVTTNGASVVTTNRWTSAQVLLTSVRNARSSSLTLSGIDFTRSVTATGGVIGGSTGNGTLTMAVNLPNGAWTATIATHGTVNYDASGLPTQGRWQITLPYNRIDLQLATGSATITVDHGPDGTIDRTWTYTVNTLAAQAV